MTGDGYRSPPRPPRLSAWLLDICLPAGEHGQIIRGDLLEEFAARAAAGSLPSARAWYRRQALSVAARYLVNPQKASLMDTLRQDAKYAVRSLAKSRGLTTAVLATLTIGIGAATAIFSVLYAVVIRPLPLPDANRLMFMTEYATNGGGPRRTISISWPNFADWRDRLTSFEGVAASRSVSFSIVDPEQPDRVIGRQATWNFFRVMGVAPALGRDFQPDDDRPGAAGVVLIRHEYWQRQYGGAADILGLRQEHGSEHPADGRELGQPPRIGARQRRRRAIAVGVVSDDRALVVVDDEHRPHASRVVPGVAVLPLVLPFAGRDDPALAD